MMMMMMMMMIGTWEGNNGVCLIVYIATIFARKINVYFWILIWILDNHHSRYHSPSHRHIFFPCHFHHHVFLAAADADAADDADADADDDDDDDADDADADADTDTDDDDADDADADDADDDDALLLSGERHTNNNM